MLATSGPGPSDSRARGQNEDEYVLVLIDQLENFLRLVAFAHHAFGGDAGNAVGARGVFAELRIGFFVRLRAHDVGDAEPLLALSCISITRSMMTLPPMRAARRLAK